MAFVDREGGCVEEPLPVPGQDPWGSWEHRLPQLTTPHQAWGPSLPALLPGLPDEAFESLTQLQHIYVAYNKVSAPPTPYWAPGLAHLGSHSTDCRGQHGAGRGPPGPVNCVPTALGGPPVSAPFPPSCGSGCQPSDRDLPTHLWGEAGTQVAPGPAQTPPGLRHA